METGSKRARNIETNTERDLNKYRLELAMSGEAQGKPKIKRIQS